MDILFAERGLLLQLALRSCIFKFLGSVFLFVLRLYDSSRYSVVSYSFLDLKITLLFYRSETLLHYKYYLFSFDFVLSNEIN